MHGTLWKTSAFILRLCKPSTHLLAFEVLALPLLELLGRLFGVYHVGICTACRSLSVYANLRTVLPLRTHVARTEVADMDRIDARAAERAATELLASDSMFLVGCREVVWCYDVVYGVKARWLS